MGNPTKKFLVAAIAAAVFSGAPALAADMAVKAPPIAAVAAPVYSWTGFYVGGNIGYGWGQSSNAWDYYVPFGLDTACSVPGNTATGALCAPGNDSNKLNGAIGGPQAGYNLQFGKFLAGVETDFQFSGQARNQNFNTSFVVVPTLTGLGTVSTAYTEKLTWFGTLRGRLGIAADRLLFYGTGGLAYGDVRNTGSATATCTVGITGCPPSGIAPLANWDSSATKVGWTAGAGVEGIIAGNWSLKVEYLYVDLGTANTTFGTLPGCFGNSAGCGGYGAGSGSVSSRITDNIVRLGINYKFN